MSLQRRGRRGRRRIRHCVVHTGNRYSRFPTSIPSSPRKGMWITPRSQLSNFQLEGVNVYKVNTISGTVGYSQAFATGGTCR